MGMSSIYCGVSNIKITEENQKVYILPLINRNKNNVMDYRTHIPAMLPILGSYNGCGGIQNIVKDDNTQLIESYFNMPINDFIDELINYNSFGGGITDNLNILEIREYEYMWILKSVYDELSINLSTEFDNNYSYENINDWRTYDKDDLLNYFYEFFGNNYVVNILNLKKLAYSDKDVSEIYDMLVDKKFANKYRLLNEYLKPENIEKYADRIVALYNIQNNLGFLCKQFTPFIMYQTTNISDKKVQKKIFEIFIKSLKTVKE